MDAESFRRLHSAQFHQRFLRGGVRCDGRRLQEHRAPLSLTTAVAGHAQGSALCRLGDTTVMAAIKAEVTVPSESEPRNGFLEVQVDLSNMSGAHLGSDSHVKPHSLDQSAAMASRITAILMSAGCVDLESLCIEEGRVVWFLYVDVICLSDAGNVMDAAILAVSAALQDVMLPGVSITDTDEVLGNAEAKTPLRVNSLLIPVSFACIGSEYLVTDPSREEEEVSSWSCTVVCKNDGTFCSVIEECTVQDRVTTVGSKGKGACDAASLLRCMQHAEKAGPFLAELLGLPWTGPKKSRSKEKGEGKVSSSRTFESKQ